MNRLKAVRGVARRVSRRGLCRLVPSAVRAERTVRGALTLTAASKPRRVKNVGVAVVHVVPRWTQKGIVSFETETERSAAHADELCIESSLLLRSRAAAAAEGGGGAFVMAASMSGVSSDARGADAFAGLLAVADAALSHTM